MELKSFLRGWLSLTAVITIGHCYQATDYKVLAQKLFDVDGRRDVTPMYSRLFSQWNLFFALLRLTCVVFFESKPLYVVTMGSFVATIAHFLAEIVLYRTTGLNNMGVAATLTTSSLSGRFLVTALPTIYHVKDGVFRAYSGPRDKDDLISFIEEKKWPIIDAMPNWKHPDSYQMAVVAWFFKLSMTIRDLHNFLVEGKGLPSWVSYAVIGLATLLLGCVLGSLMVCVIDRVFPATPSGTSSAVRKGSSAESKKQQKKEKKQQRKAQDAQKGAKVDKLSDIDSSQASGQDSQLSQSEGEEPREDGGVRERKGHGKKDTTPVANGKQTHEGSPKKKK